jgi:hypothetical protein
MAMTAREKAIEELFDNLSADLVALRPEFVDAVLCPLCIEKFSRAAITDKSIDGLSIEHIVPAALGGRLQTLTCRRCNNRDGSALDSHLVSMIRVQDWAEADGSALKGSVNVGGVELPMRISMGKDQNLSTIQILGGKQVIIEKFKEMMLGFGEGDKVNLTFSLGYAELKARQSLVRSAYLALFADLGYRLVLSDAGSFTRGILSGTDIPTIRLLTPQISNVEITNVDNPLVITPIGAVAYLVLMRTDTLHERHHGVILPGPRVTEGEIPSTLSEIAGVLDGKQCTIQVAKIFPAS